MPLKTLFGDNAALQEYVRSTTDNMLMEYISITGVRRGTGDAGATPDIPVVEVEEEEVNADDPGPAGEIPGSTDVVGAPGKEPTHEGDPSGGNLRPDQDPSAGPTMDEPKENPETLPATSTHDVEEVESSDESGTDSPDTSERVDPGTLPTTGTGAVGAHRVG
eukprot:502671-Prorocentrum_lima.AAC.1